MTEDVTTVEVDTTGNSAGVFLVQDPPDPPGSIDSACGSKNDSLAGENTSGPSSPTVGILKKRLSTDSLSPTRKDCRGRVISTRDDAGKLRHSITWPDELAEEEREQIEKDAEEKDHEKPPTDIAEIHQVVSYKAYNKDGDISSGCTCTIL